MTYGREAQAFCVLLFVMLRPHELLVRARKMLRRCSKYTILNASPRVAVRLYGDRVLVLVVERDVDRGPDGPGGRWPVWLAY